MSNHKIAYVEDKGRHHGRCSCRFQTKVFLHKWQAEDEVREHLALVDRVRAYLETKNPTVKSQHDYYRERADDPDETPENRRLWQQLADELEPRVKARKGEVAADDEPMFEMEPVRKSGGNQT